MRRLALTLLTLIVFPVSAATSLAGRIVDVRDGDTVILSDAGQQEYRIRLAFIDAPESNQPFGAESMQSLRDMALQREASAECSAMDRYGRHVCQVFVNGKDVNALQVARGFAWVYRQYAPKASPLYQLEYQARSNRTGLWSAQNPTPPWEWRRAEK